MKLTIKDDEEILEGTPEELAEYYNRTNPVIEVNSKDANRVDFDEILRNPMPTGWFETWPHADLPLDPWTYKVTYLTHTPECLITVAQGGWWSVIPPSCTCGAVKYPINYSKTTTST